MDDQHLPIPTQDDSIYRKAEQGHIEEALNMCLHTYGVSIGNVCMAWLGSESKTEQVVIETFVAAHRSLTAKKYDPHIRAWILNLARKACARVLESDSHLVQAEPGSIHAALRNLKPSEREAIVLRYVAGLTASEIALMSGTDELSIRKRIGRALMGMLEPKLGATEKKVTSDSAFVEDLSAILDGDTSALERHAAKLTEMDEYRDLRHEAVRLTKTVALAGSKYTPASDIEARVIESGTPPTRVIASPAPYTNGNAISSNRKESPQQYALPHRGETRAWPFFLVMGTLAAIGSVGVLTKIGKTPNDSKTTASHWTGALEGEVTQLVRAGSEEQSGLELRGGNASFKPAHIKSEFTAGDTIRTDALTRAKLTLNDGSLLILDHNTEITLEKSRERKIRIHKGMVMADVGHLESGPKAVFVTETGTFEVLGTKFVLASSDAMSSIQVVRGEVSAQNRDNRMVVSSGQEGLVPKQGPLSLGPATNLATSLTWSELSPPSNEVPALGLGELRARKPGDNKDRERPLFLSNHKVSVKISGPIARTEIEETFRNDGGSQLEGIYRFPLPPDAHIASLGLEVNGAWQEGAFVERDRAQKIWRGVIRNATPIAARQPKEEYIWVPGPWRDPALLEWQRGGRFELRIFPIPARGERRIRIAYTQVLAMHGDGRRYVYPLAHSSDPSLRAGRFEIDIRVAGSDPERRTSFSGYPLQASWDGKAETFSFAANSFFPAGDLLVDCAPLKGPSELRWWTFEGHATTPPPEKSREENADAAQQQKHLDQDSRPYVVFSLHPKLPTQTRIPSRDYVLVADSSQSMMGERFERVSRMASAMVREMDRRDRFILLACDLRCESYDVDLKAPSEETAIKVYEWLKAIRPGGSTNLVETFEAARRAAPSSTGRQIKIVYFGDGMASVGHRRASLIASSVKKISSLPNTTVSTISIGGDADTLMLETIARVGGGQHIPYTPGQTAEHAALATLQAGYGASLERVTVRFPDGITDIAPSEFATLRDGEEILVAARMDRSSVHGEVEIRGIAGEKDFVQRYPIEVNATSSSGNMFVPRLWASRTIDHLELTDNSEQNAARIVALSKAFGVMSRRTSLLVLESEAMFRAFGVDRAQSRAEWTGEDDVESGETGETESEPGGEIAADSEGSIGALSGTSGVQTSRGRSGGGSGQGLGSLGADLMKREAPSSPAAAAPARRFAADEAPRELAANAEPETRAKTASQPTLAQGAEVPRDQILTTPARGRWMKVVWYREGNIRNDIRSLANIGQSVSAAEAAYQSNLDSRDRLRALVRALSRAGDIERGLELSEQWATRDPLDAEALVNVSDFLGRKGHRDEALRLLSGIVDLAPDNQKFHERLADAFERAGDTTHACAERIALAETFTSDRNHLAQAAHCLEELGANDEATEMLSSFSGNAIQPYQGIDDRRFRGELTLNAQWDSATDLDLSIIAPDGTRLSWMGGRNTLMGEQTSHLTQERLGLRRATAGSYLIEINRTAATDATRVRGKVGIQILGTNRTIPFQLVGDRTVIARIEVTRRSRTEPTNMRTPW